MISGRAHGRLAGMAAGLVACALVLLAASCQVPPEVRGKPEIEKTYGSDAVGRLTVRVSKGSIQTADDLSLEIEVRSAPGWKASMPEIADSLGEFSVLEAGPEARRLEPDGLLTTSRTYLLEPFLPGAYAIPPFIVSFENDAGRLYTVGSEEIPIQVTSVLPPQLGEQDIEGIAEPHTIPSAIPVWIGLGGAVLLAAAAGAAVALRRRLGRNAREMTAGETAIAELEQLLRAGLVEQGRLQEFYEGISDIARRYVERRFSLHAPRRTTEEFLAEAAGHESLRGHAELLQGFLSACDLVKFARHTPSGDEVGLAVGACRTFLTATVEEKPA